jgi:hypothetical protein
MALGDSVTQKQGFSKMQMFNIANIYAISAAVALVAGVFYWRMIGVSLAGLAPRGLKSAPLPVPAQLEALAARGRHRNIRYPVAPVVADFHGSADSHAGHISVDGIAVKASEPSGERQTRTARRIEGDRHFAAAIYRHFAIVKPVIRAAEIIEVTVAAPAEANFVIPPGAATTAIPIVAIAIWTAIDTAAEYPLVPRHSISKV